MEEQYKSILDIIPANVAVIDHNGTIIIVNKSWKAFARRNEMKDPDFGAGKNYIEICEKASGDSSEEGPVVADKLKKILSGRLDYYSLEYPCHCEKKKRWFLVYVKPIMMNKSCGAVIMHINITKRVIAERKLKEALKRIRLLTMHVENIREEERKNIAREVHDDLGQALVTMKLLIQSIKRQLPKENHKAVKKASEISELINHTVDAIHRISEKLRPEILDSLGLISAIEWQVNEFNRNSDIRFEIKNINTDHISFNKQVEVNIFRILQEALSNIVKHSGAQNALILLRIDNNQFIMEINDDGRGISQEELSNPSSFGILSMKERAQLTGGRLDILANKEKGTLIRFALPSKKIKKPRHKNKVRQGG